MTVLCFVYAHVHQMASNEENKLQIHPASIIKPSGSPQRKLKKVTFFDFKGLMAPVFTCFKSDERLSLELEHIDRYAEWLKSENINGVLVNSVTGEGPALGLQERKMNTEAWWKAALKHNLILMVQIGGAPLSDVLDMSKHAETLGVHAVLCLPELFYKPRSIDELAGYCKIIAKKCHTRPFFYYHIPEFTSIYFDMSEFCSKAEEFIPNFFGIQYSSHNLDMAIKCQKQGRVILLGSGSLLASAMLVGFESGMFPFLNGMPKQFLEIYNAMKQNDVTYARVKQMEVNEVISEVTQNTSVLNWVHELKAWFNRESVKNGIGFTAGPARSFY